jgi:tRNA(fMet)-specific endonuclease VapC
MFLLDTDVCIDVLRGRAPEIAERMAAHHPSEIRMSSVVRAELYFGARRSAHVSENLTLLERFFEPFQSLPFDDGCASSYGLVRAELAGGGTPIGPNDLLIAATARAHDLTLVTRNVAEFGRVAGLRLEDWSRPSPSSEPDDA